MPPKKVKKVPRVKKSHNIKTESNEVISNSQGNTYMSESVKKAYDNLSETAKKKYHDAMAFLASDRAKSLGKNAIIGILSLILIGGFAKYGTDAVEHMQDKLDVAMYTTFDGVVELINRAFPPESGLTVKKAYDALQTLVITMLAHIGGARSGETPPYFDFGFGRGRGLKKAKAPKKVKDPPKDSLYYQVTESPLTKEFYDIITSDEVVTFSKDFLKVLISMWLYKTVYDAAAPSRPAVETQTDTTTPPNRGIVVEGRRGVVVEGRRDDDFGVAPIDVEDVIRLSGVDISNLSEPEQVILDDFIATTPSGESSCFGCFGLGLMDDISEKFKISPETKKLGKEAFKALLLAGLAGAVGNYSLNYAKDYISPPKGAPSYDYGERAKNWTAEVKNKNMMNAILDEFSDISEDVGSVGSHFSGSSGSYGLGLKKTKKGAKNIKKIETDKFESSKRCIAVLKNPKISKINNKIEEAIRYIYDKSPPKEAIMLFISVVFALGTALIFANSQTLTDTALDNIMNFKRILEDCANGSVSLNSIQAYIGHYLSQARTAFGGKLKKSKGKIISGKIDRRAICSVSEVNPLPESFYQKRIKPITKRAYDIITSDETITVAKTLAQIAFLTLVMYGIKELGATAYSFMALENQDPRTPRQVLAELGESEIGRPTYYTEASGRNRGQVIEYDKSGYPRDYPQDVGSDSRFSEDYNPSISKINRMLSEAESDIYRSKAKTDKLIEMLKKEDPIHIKNLMLKHPVLRDIKAKNPHKFTTEFPEQLPTLKEKINWKKGQMLSRRTLEDKQNWQPPTEGSGLKDDAIELSKATMSKLKKMAKKMYDKIKSEEGQAAVKGVTVATILAGLTALMRSRMGASSPQLSPEELKEQYMERIGESVLF